MKCPNCNAENPEGMKFCGECGTKLPEPMNHCPTCNKDWPLTMKFCGECGFKFGGGSAAGAGGLSMGDKNVIAGDVVSNVSNVDNSSTVNNTTNTTTIYNSDETKQVKKCHVCGGFFSITQMYECPECHEYCCSDCYDGEAKTCKTCVNNKNNQKAAESAKVTSYLTTSEKIELQKAKDLHYEDGNVTEAFEIANGIWENHKDDEEVLTVLMPIIANYPDKMVEFCSDENLANLLEKYPKLDTSPAIGLGMAWAVIKAGDLDAAERTINEIKRVSEESVYQKYIEVLFNIALYKKYESKDFLTKATTAVEGFTPSSDKLEASWQIVLTNLLNSCNGEEAMSFDKDFCQDNNLYYWFVNSDPLIFSNPSAADFVLVEGGTYTMGSEKTPAESRITATVGDLYVCKHPVTQKEYNSIMGKGSCHEISGGEYPVTYICWYNAIEYCNARSIKEGFEPYYIIDKEHKFGEGKFDKYSWTVTEDTNSEGYRLPTQEEWEYFARGGKLSEEYLYVGSNDLDEVAWRGQNILPEICKKKPNELGLYDLGGLVWELCSPREIRSWKDGTEKLIIHTRGRGYVESTSFVKEDKWYAAQGKTDVWGDTDDSYEFQGFRVVRSKLK